MDFNLTLMIMGIVIILVFMMRHVRKGIGRKSDYDIIISKYKIRVKEKDKEFGGDVKWMIDENE